MQLHTRESGSLFWQNAVTRLTGFDPQAGNSFLGQLDWMLRRLSAAHVRISLVRLVLPAHVAGAEQAAARIAQDLDDAYGMAGVMWDGSVVAAFFGPRQAGAAGDRQQTRAILRRLRQALRNAGIASEIYPDTTKIKKQLDYANKKQIPYALVIGSEEVSSGLIAFKDLESGEQEKIYLDDIIDKLRR